MLILAAVTMTAALGTLLVMFLAAAGKVQHDDRVGGIELVTWLVFLALTVCVAGFVLAFAILTGRVA